MKSQIITKIIEFKFDLHSNLLEEAYSKYILNV